MFKPLFAMIFKVSQTKSNTVSLSLGRDFTVCNNIPLGANVMIFAAVIYAWAEFVGVTLGPIQFQHFSAPPPPVPALPTNIRLGPSLFKNT